MLQRVKRQGDDAIGTMMQLGLKFAPLIINSMLGGGGGGGGGLADLAASFLGGGGSPAAAKPAVNTKLQSTADKTDKIGATVSSIFSRLTQTKDILLVDLLGPSANKYFVPLLSTFSL